MLDRDYFEHTNPEGHDFDSRYSAAGYNCKIDIGYAYSLGGENIYLNWTFESRYVGGGIAEYKTQEAVVSSTVDGWMNSPGHRKNILNPNWNNEGIGVAIEPNGKILITQDFC